MTPELDLDEIQGDMLVGMQKNAELFVFFKITDAPRFKALASGYLAGQVTSARRAREREQIVERRKELGDLLLCGPSVRIPTRAKSPNQLEVAEVARR